MTPIDPLHPFFSGLVGVLISLTLRPPLGFWGLDVFSGHEHKAPFSFFLGELAEAVFFPKWRAHFLGSSLL